MGMDLIQGDRDWSYARTPEPNELAEGAGNYRASKERKRTNVKNNVWSGMKGMKFFSASFSTSSERSFCSYVWNKWSFVG